MNIQVSVPDWLKLSHETRVKLAEIFQVPKSKGSQMEQMGSESIIKSDGHTHEDLSVITVEKMKAYLGGITVDDFATLFDACVAKVEEDKELEAKVEPVDVKQIVLEQWVKDLGNMKSQAITIDMLPHLIETVKRVFEIKKENDAITRLPAQRGRPKKAK